MKIKKYKFTKEQQESFDFWMEDGNVIKNSDGTYSTQDSMYRNRLENMDALKEYFYNEFIKGQWDSYENGGSTNEKYFIEFLNKKKGFQRDRVYFDSFSEAEDWGRKNLEKFNSDMIRVGYKNGGSIDDKHLVAKAIEYITGTQIEKDSISYEANRVAFKYKHKNAWSTLNQKLIEDTIKMHRKSLEMRGNFEDGGEVEKVLFAVKIGEPDWAEQLITENESRIEEAKKWAEQNGFDRFRVAEIDMSKKPKFAKGGQTPSQQEVINRIPINYNIELDYKIGQSFQVDVMGGTTNAYIKSFDFMVSEVDGKPKIDRDSYRIHYSVNGREESVHYSYLKNLKEEKNKITLEVPYSIGGGIFFENSRYDGNLKLLNGKVNSFKILYYGDRSWNNQWFTFYVDINGKSYNIDSKDAYSSLDNYVSRVSNDARFKKDLQDFKVPKGGKLKTKLDYQVGQKFKVAKIGGYDEAEIVSINIKIDAENGQVFKNSSLSKIEINSENWTRPYEYYYEEFEEEITKKKVIINKIQNEIEIDVKVLYLENYLTIHRYMGGSKLRMDNLGSYVLKVNNSGYKVGYVDNRMGDSDFDIFTSMDDFKQQILSNNNYSRGGNVSSIEKKVAEVNRLIDLANEKNISVVDSSSTWESPMKYKPIRYSNGVLYIEYQELDLYKYNRTGVSNWVTKKDKILKRDIEFDNPLNDIAKMYRKALREEGIDYKSKDVKENKKEDKKEMEKDNFDDAGTSMVMYHEKKGNFIVPKGQIYLWLYDIEGSADKLQKEEFDWVFYPYASQSMAWQKGFIPPLEKIWTKKFQKEHKGSENLLGVIKAYLMNDGKKLYIDMMSVNPTKKKKGIMSYMIKDLRDSFNLTQEQVEFSKLTEEGEKFVGKKTYGSGGDINPDALKYSEYIDSLSDSEVNEKYTEMTNFFMTKPEFFDGFEDEDISIEEKREALKSHGNYADGGWVLVDADTERKLGEYETESEARKMMYEYEGNSEILEKSKWDKLPPNPNRHSPAYNFADGGGVDVKIEKGDIINKNDGQVISKYEVVIQPRNNKWIEVQKSIYEPRQTWRVNNIYQKENGDLWHKEGSTYADGGDVPFSDKMFHLPLEMVVYVPSTQDVDNVISVDDMDNRVNEVKTYLAGKFGGYTASDRLGGFVDSTGNLVNEDVVQVVSFSTKEDFENHKEELIKQIAEWGKKWGQEAIGFEFEGDLMYVPQELNEKNDVEKYRRGGFMYEVQKKGSPSNDMRETMFTAKNLTELKKKIIEKYGTSEGFLVRRRTEQGYYAPVKFENGGSTEDYNSLTRGQIEDKIAGLRLRIAKTKKQISGYETTNRGKYNNLWEQKVVPLQKELDYLADLWGNSKYSVGGAIYPDLSLQKADVVNDSVVLDEFQIKKMKNTFSIEGRENTKITSSKDSVDILRLLIDKDTINAYEQAYILYLNKNNKVIGYYHHSSGGIDGTIMDVQMISGMALKSLAKGVIIAHNHPSENTLPSDADKRITTQLQNALKLFNIVLLDSIILTNDSYSSFADNGLM